MNNMIAISGNATSGKDTLFSIIQEILESKNIKCSRYALADDLKLEINQFTLSNYGISAFTKNPKEKETIRPLMVVHGKIKRNLTFGKYWTSLLQQKIDLAIESGILPIVTDIRYCEFSEDEHFWAKNVNKATLIHVTRFDKDNNKIEPANQDEAENELKLILNAHATVVWPTTDNKEFLIDLVKVQLKDILQKYE